MIARLLSLAVLTALLAPGVARAGEPDPLAPAYEADLSGADGGRRWTGTMTLTVTNPDLAPLGRIWVRLWGNGPNGCRRRAVRIGAVTGAVAGRRVVRCTAVPLDLALPLAPGARGSVTLELDIRAPRRFDRFGGGGRRLALFSNALPALAHREGGRWRLDRYFSLGEAWTYPAADWRVRLAAPRGVDVAAPGVREAGGFGLLRRGRDYSWAAGDLRRRTGRVAGVDVTVWAPRRTRPARLAHALRRVRRRLPQLARLFGPYGWPDLQVVLTNAAAMEHTALIMTPDLDLVITHELAHEWWYALVSNDQARAPWLDEGFATWAEWETRGVRPLCRRLPRRVRRATTRGVDHYRDRVFLYGAVYDGGGCLLASLERRLGRRAFREALRAYAMERRYGWHTAGDFMAAMEAAAAPRRLRNLWRAYGLA